MAQVRKLHPPLHVAGIVLTMYDVRNSLTLSVEETARLRFGDLVMQATIPVNVRNGDGVKSTVVKLGSRVSGREIERIEEIEVVDYHDLLEHAKQAYARLMATPA